jgi:hypothetical protein
MNTPQKHLTALVCMVAVMGGFLHLVGQTPEPKKKLATDGVNWITDHGDGISSQTLIHVTNKDAPQLATLEDVAKTRGKLVIDKADADENARTLMMAKTLLVKYENMMRTVAGKDDGFVMRQGLLDEANRTKQVLDDISALLTKWRARADSLKGEKP